MGFYTIGTSGTISGPDDYDPEAASKKLYDGMKGLGTDENVIVEVIASHTNEQRQEIKDKYKTMYGKDLVEDLETELGGSFAKIVLALMKLPEEYIIESIHDAISGLGTDEYTLIGLLCTRTNDELEEMKTAYKEKYEKDMEEDVAEDLSGDFRSLIVGIINGGRDESEEVDSEKVQEDAKNLHEASEGAGTREEVFQSIFNQRSYEHMRQVFDAYKELADGKEVEELIESEFSGSLQAAYLALVKIFRNVSEFYVERLRATIKGAGTDDETLIRILVLRSEIDLKDIIDLYEANYGSSLQEDVMGDTSGDYRLTLERLLTRSEVVEDEITARDAGEGEEVIPPATDGVDPTENGDGEGEGKGEDGGDAAEEGATEEAAEGGDDEPKENGGEGEEGEKTENAEDGDAEAKEDAPDGETEEGEEAKEEEVTKDDASETKAEPKDDENDGGEEKKAEDEESGDKEETGDAEEAGDKDEAGDKEETGDNEEAGDKEESGDKEEKDEEGDAETKDEGNEEEKKDDEAEATDGDKEGDGGDAEASKEGDDGANEGEDGAAGESGDAGADNADDAGSADAAAAADDGAAGADDAAAFDDGGASAE